MQWLELENRELKQALSALKIVQSLHPEQRSDHNMHRDGSHSCPGRNEGIIRAPGAQHATADEWIALMEEEERNKEVKKREAKQKKEPDCMVSSYVDAIKIKENALPDLVAPFEVEAPTSSQFQQASPVALELERQEEEELGEYTSYYMPLTFSLLFV
ncbi:hypothetical protein EMCRGX_G017876 [Ephydatia muelleri]